ncbi:hypothetical protein DFH11DRAFT_1625643 [Phellopilus nigrolimitatus]|nr:hypothetical protein DFH11DRAFT_1625643 [Phellopilus nigrolimitatus]
MRKRLALVCRTWSNIATPTLYSLVYLHRVGQLSALVRTLEESRSGRGGSKLGFGRWVEHIRSTFYVPQMWEDVYRTDLQRLVAFCPAVRTLVHKPVWDTRITPHHDLALLQSLDMKKPLLCLRELCIDEPVLWTVGAHSCTLSSFQNLAKLHLTVDPWVYSYSNDTLINTIAEISLPNLATLICDVPSKIGYANLEIIARHWVIPALRHLVINLFWSWEPPLESLCAAHGAQLRTLCFDNRPCHTMIAPSLALVLAHCPALEQLTYPHDTVPVLSLVPKQDRNAGTRVVYAMLRRVKFFPELLSTRISGTPVEKHIEMLSQRSFFPALEAIVLLDPRLREMPVDTSILPSAYVVTLREWTAVLAQLDICLLNCDEQPLTIALEEDVSNGERDSEIGDLSYEDDSTIAFPSSDSSKSDLESDSGSDSMVFERNFSTVPPPLLGREEALTIYERTLDRESEMSDSEPSDASASL